MKIENLNKKYKKSILENVTFELEEKKIYTLLGRNGVGKTTLLKIIAGLVSPNNGKIEKNNKSVLYIPEHTYFLDFLSGYDNLCLICDVYNISKNELNKMIERYGIKSFVYELVVNYSQGMKHQLSLISAFLINPDVLLLDEPLTSLDPINIENFKMYIKEFSSKNKTVVISTHIIPIAYQLSDEILILKSRMITNIKNTITEEELSNVIFNKI
ncbi:ABC transporter ATP-binding protein [Staphylococcus delphini]|uniref:ABC transporter ATP-binding protein n=1 Tax=Staphylococcus delphini TaxID=53344 RepID=UPI0023B22158|nr:ABC transporter ATP-binding protein [Staphylococcus delphini]MDE9752573.1 ABC transporter ATP-binding protein [Staphylococcus delphini]MDE9790552.1 ABC transporter ATP-binding protein [Staphylococcus delphini]MDE9791623.1 ABC transporter ATP-binding protein [Staphylococcus delphini]MDE9794763.1 ABC transporter ATP-binding protein [Staphylococcus delphini]MDE9796948.1 ABC transporter ATP-binding protein [Staphylococcus delphini]